MTETPEENPRAALEKEFDHAPVAQRKKDESKKSASSIRFTRVANGLDRLFAGLLEAK